MGFGCRTTSNYGAIVLANMETKILKLMPLEKLRSYDHCDKYQYGFKKDHSTAIITYFPNFKVVMWLCEHIHFGDDILCMH